jgi:type 1 fimbria pilin
MNKHMTVIAITTLLAMPATALAEHYRGGYVSFGGGNLIVGGTTVGANETFTVGSDVKWVHDAGATVDVTTIKAGRPMSVHYAPSGSTRRVERVVVHKDD